MFMWKRKSPMDTISIILIALALILLIIALMRGKSFALNGLKLTAVNIWQNLPLLVAGFLIAGLMQVLLLKELISTWLGSQSGIKGVLLGCLTGGLIPGSPYAVFPIVSSLYKSGAGLGAIVGFVTAWSLWSVSRLPVEVALIDPKVALIRYTITLMIPPAAGLLAQALSRFIS